MRFALAAITVFLALVLPVLSCAEEIYGYDGLASVKPEVSTLILTSDGNFSMVFRNMVGAPITVTRIELTDETTNLSCGSPQVTSVPIGATFKAMMYMCDIRPYRSKAFYAREGLYELKYPKVRVKAEYSATVNDSTASNTDFGRLIVPFDDSPKTNYVWAAIVDPVWGFYNLVLLLIYLMPPALLASTIIWLRSPYKKKVVKILLLTALVFALEAYSVYAFWKAGLFTAPIR
jgi:hypothetical protein